MTLKSMKITEREARTIMGGTCCDPSDPPEYPYGLTLNIDDATLKKLGIESPPAVGTKMMVVAMAEVRGTSQHEDKDRVDKNMTLQITEMSLSPEGKPIEQSMYPTMNK